MSEYGIKGSAYLMCIMLDIKISTSYAHIIQ